MSTGAVRRMCKDADNTRHKATTRKAAMRRVALAGSARSVCADCATHVGRSWLDVAFWLKTCWSGSRTWQNGF
ncbi:unnamed protein product [Prunus armeniaca]